MPNPREAIYDVLKAKQRRNLDQRLSKAVAPDQREDLLADWERYEAANTAAHGDYKGRRH